MAKEASRLKAEGWLLLLKELKAEGWLLKDNRRKGAPKVFSTPQLAGHLEVAAPRAAALSRRDNQ